LTPPQSAPAIEAGPISSRPQDAKNPKPVTDGRRPLAAQLAVYSFVLVPLLAAIIAVPFAWGWGLSWTDVAIATVFYVISGMGITVGFHRHFTHGAF
jgi:stearoyl-CoA desaturase (delta-9 desaturase)